MATKMEVNTDGRVRKRLTLKEKKEILRLYPKQICMNEVMRLFDIKSRTTVVRLEKKREFFLSVQENDKISKKIHRKRKFEEVEEILLDFVEENNKRDMPISRNDLKQEALNIARRLQIEGFTGSNGWIQKFMKRNDLGSISLHGEEAAASQEVADNWIANDVPNITQPYRNENSFNCDETGTQYRALPKKTLARKGQEKCGKVNKERLSVLFCCSAAG
ncbi:hypothetical protein RvY_17280-2 [Ramazzottius varieornatus]|uniref:HTH CENPB-type domain-containing protein n=1 Tax=Ramazzottius varieornatus TaxID=947166 RepID=A0A1D1W5I7_RAMVA|nr:hypothetical protein RvY_17280-2 [Ramazzottius varieornatus]